MEANCTTLNERDTGRYGVDVEHGDYGVVRYLQARRRCRTPEPA